MHRDTAAPVPSGTASPPRDNTRCAPAHHQNRWNTAPTMHKCYFSPAATVFLDKCRANVQYLAVIRTR